MFTKCILRKPMWNSLMPWNTSFEILLFSKVGSTLQFWPALNKSKDKKRGRKFTLTKMTVYKTLISDAFTDICQFFPSRTTTTPHHFSWMQLITSCSEDLKKLRPGLFLSTNTGVTPSWSAELIFASRVWFCLDILFIKVCSIQFIPERGWTLK